MARGMADNDEESVRGSEGDGDHFYLNENGNDMGGGNGDFDRHWRNVVGDTLDEDGGGGQINMEISDEDETDDE
jgi:hypothetical protein